MLPLEYIDILPWALFILLGVLIVIGAPIAVALILTAFSIITLDPRLNAWVMFQRMYSGIDSFVLLAVPLFLLAGNLMNSANITDRLILLCMRLVGHLRGSLAHVNVMVSMLFAGVSGASTADSAGVGSIMIPAMKKEGYPVTFSVAVTAVSSVMGIVIPPSINMIVWGALTNTSIAGLFLGGIIPGLMIGFSQFFLNAVLVRKYNVPIHKKATFAEVMSSSKDGIIASVIPVIIIAGITFGFATPTEAAVLAVVYALFLGFFVYKELTFKKLLKASSETVNLSALSLFALVGASIFGYLISFYKIPPMLMSGVNITDPITLLVIMAVVMLLVGTFMDSLPAMAILAPIFMPLAINAGVHPVHFGVISVMVLGLGLVTPPYGLCLMIASKIAGISMIKALGITLLYLAFILVAVALIIIFPDLVLGVPKLLVPDLVG